MTTLTECRRCREGNYFVATYPPFSAWTAPGAERYRLALDEPPAAGARRIGLYVHVPFCEKRCDYCYYLSYEGRLDDADAYVEALVREMALYAATPALGGAKVDFVYFGGGTPSVLSARRLARMLSGLHERSSWNEVREISFECAPRSVARDKLVVLREHGVTRVSLGIQQMDDRVLALNGRLHDVAHVERAYEAIRGVGFDVVNVDLIAGLPGQTDESFLCGLDRVIGLLPDCVTIYQLEIPLNTPLYRALRDGEARAEPASWEAQRLRLKLGFERLEAAGYTVQSGYMAVRSPEHHRFLYQDEQYQGADLLGLGASSFSQLGGIQQQNVAALDGYLEALAADRLPLWRGYEMSDEERFVRELVLQLKLGHVERGSFVQRFGVDPAARFAPLLAELEAQELARLDGETIRLTREGLVCVDQLILDFYAPRHRGLRYS